MVKTSYLAFSRTARLKKFSALTLSEGSPFRARAVAKRGSLRFEAGHAPRSFASRATIWSGAGFVFMNKQPPAVINFDLPRPPMRLIGIALIVIALLVVLWTSYYTVPAESEGVVLRFGKFLKTVEPGLHFKIPLGVDEVSVLPTRRQLKLEFGFYTSGYTNPDQPTMQQVDEKSMVTGDLNAALVEWVVQYRISDPKEYLFDVRNPGQTLRDLSESSMREIIGDRTVDEVITIGRQDIEISALTRMQELAKRYKLGVRVDQVQLKNVNPPREVQASFNEVNRAQQDRENAINIANGDYNQAVPRARGEADQTIRGAEGYRFKRVNEAEGDVASFNAMLEQYSKAAEITRTRLYLETMGDVLPSMGPKIIIDDSMKQLLPILPLSTKMPEVK
jgi:membrane protease subunit HflK